MKRLQIHSESSTVDALREALVAKQATVDALMLGFAVTDFPVVEQLSFDVVYEPAAPIERLGGDWYDIFRLPDGRVAFSVGDVCGKGLGAAVKMGQAKQAIKVAASLPNNDPMPLAVLTQTNTVIFLNDHHVEFTTAVYGVIDTSSRKVTYACAGHHPPILAKRGEAARVLPNHGFALGVERDLPHVIQEHEFRYEPGTLFVLYTDGLIESRDNGEEGESRLLMAARAAVDGNAANPAHFIAETVVQGEPEHPDDVTVLSIFFKA
jgi:serine phosphatase RsbU (regulator of sigma subunit)